MICRLKPYEGDKPYIFFSYCHEDKEIVYPIIEIMGEAGYRIWFDEGIQAGADWPEVIAKHLVKCTACVVAISSKSITSHNCRNEMNFAVEHEKPLVSILLDTLVLPLGIQLQLSSTHQVRLGDYRGTALLEKIKGNEKISICLSSMEEAKLQFKSKDELVELGKDLEIISDEKVLLQTEQEQFCRNLKLFNIGNDNNEIIQRHHDKKLQSQAEEARRKEEAKQRRLEEDVERSQQEEEVGKKNFQETIFDDVKATVLSDDEDFGQTMMDEADTSLIIVRLKSQKYYFGRIPLTSMGRSKNQCDLYFEDAKTISEHHADIITLKGKSYVKAYKTTNGTYVNGIEIKPEESIEIIDYAEIYLSKGEGFFVAVADYADKIIQRMYLCSIMSIETGEKLYLFNDEIVLGREYSWASGAMTNERISRKHAIIGFENEKCYICDKSRNGTFINEKRIPREEKVFLMNGDRISLGREHFLYICLTLHNGEPF